jgi:ribosomal protein S18 acetylase RimI-like enzyme
VNAQTQPAVRSWRREDLETVRRIVWLTWLAAYASFIPREDLRDYYDRHYSPEALAAAFAAPGVGGFIGFRAETAAGYARTHLDRKDGEGYLASLYVLPDFQGLGLGVALLGVAEDWVGSLGRERIGVGVMTANIRALNWYERKGFRFDREEPFVMGKTAIRHRLGWKPLTGGVAAPEPSAAEFHRP